MINPAAAPRRCLLPPECATATAATISGSATLAITETKRCHRMPATPPRTAAGPGHCCLHRMSPPHAAVMQVGGMVSESLAPGMGGRDYRIPEKYRIPDPTGSLFDHALMW